MGSWDDAHEPCWKCESTNTESRGWKDYEIHCYDCGFNGQYDAAKDTKTGGYTKINYCPSCNSGGLLLYSEKDSKYSIWCLSCRDLVPIETPAETEP